MIESAKEAFQPAGDQTPGWRFSPVSAFFALLFILLFGFFCYEYFILRNERFELSRLSIFPGSGVSTFGPLVMTGILFGTQQIRRWCYFQQLDDRKMLQVALFVAVFGLVCSHWVAIALYHPQDVLNWSRMFDFRSDFSSFGGFLFGFLALFFFLKKFRLPIWPYVDAFMYGLAFGWLFGRLGCFSVHDHPGLVTQFPLAVMINNELRYDLGFLELLYTIVLVLLFSWVGLKSWYRPGLLIAIACFSYAPVRFSLDFLRVFDATYLGLTPAQWACFPLLAIGVLAWRQYRNRIS